MAAVVVGDAAIVGDMIALSNVEVAKEVGCIVHTTVRLQAVKQIQRR